MCVARLTLQVQTTVLDSCNPKMELISSQIVLCAAPQGNDGIKHSEEELSEDLCAPAD